ncbi:MAG: FlgD immunoglobulin-like domain containing protein [Bacteroidota bacterium]
MLDRRERHQATLMTPGWVLISGGLDGVPIRGSEMIDPSTRQYKKLPDMNDVRYEHSATILSGGKVLVVGSKDYDRGLPTCEIFEPLETANGNAPQWRWRRTGSLSFGRGKHRAVKLQDGRVMVIGGVHNYYPTATCEVFDPATETWSRMASMYFPREGHTATLLTDGRIIVTGGDIGGAEVATCEIFDPSKNGGMGEWKLMSALIYPRKNHTATSINNRFIVLTGAWRGGQGDRSTEMMDTWRSNPQWYLGPTMLADRSNHSATLLADGRLMLIGGEWTGSQGATSACDISEKTLAVSGLEPPTDFAITFIAPNPFSSRVRIACLVPAGANFNVTIHDYLGRAVRNLTGDAVSAGTNVLLWDGLNDSRQALPAGSYYCLLRTSGTSVVRPVQLLR